MSQIGRQELVKEARLAREDSFSPYSEFAVGSALVANGDVYTGANVEVSGRVTSVHAEMMACYNAVLDGSTDFQMMAVSPESESGVAPCGLCQHTIGQWCEDVMILEDRGENAEPTVHHLTELVGEAYSPSTRHEETVNK